MAAMDPIGPSKYRPYYNPQPAYSPTLASNTTGGISVLDSSLEYIETSPVGLIEMTRNIAKVQAIEYLGFALAQPFENAKILLQCQNIPQLINRGEDQEASIHENEEEEDDPDYFDEGTSRLQSDRRATDREGYIVQNDIDDATRPPWQLSPRLPATLRSVLDAVWTKEGMTGTFKGTNTTFLYNFLREILEGQLSGFLSVLAGVPDPILALETNDLTSLLVNIIAVGASALILAPLDIARTTIILTPVSEPRSLSHVVGLLPSKFCPAILIAPTLLDSLVPTLMQFALQDLVEPLSGIIQLFVRLPIETLLHRAQASYAAPIKTVVNLGAYNGVFGTPWWITTQEGDSVFGLYRGWKAGVWSVLGVWSLGLVAASQQRPTGTEF